jgi:hypothetical protein
MLIERIGIDPELDPFATSRDDRERCRAGIDDILCWSWAMCLAAAASSENDQGSMNLAS